ncbi:MAG: hypothetical protein BJBARM5_0398 [Candidatus Parvarchaeum acidophilus ARMAN-5]|uniref:EamA domain-containing protein n=1 Tax=Candidatus Parvarchaeum acidophilus ARMAN-5 TaxID=662762 RepID=D6GV89_PARA5|nr:MAG: hypothetical protein BJBARM5_0398 [Candidatus Parvarchaeum acidophilus ARMAN-5]
MYTVAAYFVFYSLERYNLGIINSIIGSQQALIAFFDALLFIESELRNIIIPFIIIISGIFIVGKSSAGKSRFSKYIILAFIGTLLWVFMWVLFYTINTNYPLSYYAVIQSFAFLFCLPVTWLIADKKVKKEKYGEKMKFIVVAGLMNGIASGIFSFAYKFNALLTPFIVQLTVPLVLILSFLLLKERLKKLELVGVILIILGTFIYIVI